MRDSQDKQPLAPARVCDSRLHICRVYTDARTSLLSLYDNWIQPLDDEVPTRRCRTGITGRDEEIEMDAIVLILTLAFFAVSLAYVGFCERV